LVLVAPATRTIIRIRRTQRTQEYLSSAAKNVSDSGDLFEFSPGELGRLEVGNIEAAANLRPYEVTAVTSAIHETSWRFRHQAPRRWPLCTAQKQAFACAQRRNARRTGLCGGECARAQENALSLYTLDKYVFVLLLFSCPISIGIWGISVHSAHPLLKTKR
jgi:hypothetical protein